MSSEIIATARRNGVLKFRWIYGFNKWFFMAALCDTGLTPAGEE